MLQEPKLGEDKKSPNQKKNKSILQIPSSNPKENFWELYPARYQPKEADVRIKRWDEIDPNKDSQNLVIKSELAGGSQQRIWQ